MTKFIPVINCGYSAGETPMCWQNEQVFFDTEKECEDWIYENQDNFTIDELSGYVYAQEVNFAENN